MTRGLNIPSIPPLMTDVIRGRKFKNDKQLREALY